MAKANIKGIDKAELFKALYDNAQPLGMGIFQYVPGDMAINKARKIVKEQTYFDYHLGRPMKIDLIGDELETWFYNRYNGDNAAEEIIETLRAR